MKICILGGTSELGYELNNAIESKEIISFGKQSFDIVDLDKTYHILNNIKPDIIIHAAGFTDIDQCEIKKKRLLI